jgi:hypothetical protein
MEQRFARMEQIVDQLAVVLIECRDEVQPPDWDHDHR